MRGHRQRRSAAALAIYMVMYKVYRRRLCWTRPWLMNRDLGLTRTLVQEMETGDKETVCFAGLAKGWGCLSDPTSFINASKPVKVCHIFHADSWNFVKCIRQMSLFTQANLTEFAQLCHRYLLNETLSHASIYTDIFFLWRAKFGEETLLVKTHPNGNDYITKVMVMVMIKFPKSV